MPPEEVHFRKTIEFLKEMGKVLATGPGRSFHGNTKVVIDVAFELV